MERHGDPGRECCSVDNAPYADGDGSANGRSPCAERARLARDASARDRLDGDAGRVSKLALRCLDSRSRARRHAVLAQCGEAVHARVEHEDRDGGNVAGAVGAGVHVFGRSSPCRRSRERTTRCMGELIVTGTRRSDDQRSHARVGDDAAVRVADSLKARGIKAITGGLVPGADDVSRYVDRVWMVVGRPRRRLRGGSRCAVFQRGIRNRDRAREAGSTSGHDRDAIRLTAIRRNHGLRRRAHDVSRTRLRCDSISIRHARSSLLADELKTAVDTLVYVYPESARRVSLRVARGADRARHIGAANRRGDAATLRSERTPPLTVRSSPSTRLSPPRHPPRAREALAESDRRDSLQDPRPRENRTSARPTAAASSSSASSPPGARSPTAISFAMAAGFRATTISARKRSCACSTRFARTPPSRCSTTPCRSRASTARSSIGCAARAAAGNVHAKTGSVANARSLSGYVTTADKHTLIFSLLANNWTVKQSSVDSVHNRIAVMLASMNLRDVQ